MNGKYKYPLSTENKLLQQKLFLTCLNKILRIVSKEKTAAASLEKMKQKSFIFYKTFRIDYLKPACSQRTGLCDVGGFEKRQARNRCRLKNKCTK